MNIDLKSNEASILDLINYYVNIDELLCNNISGFEPKTTFP